MVDQPKPKKTKNTKIEMNPEVSDRDTKAGEIKMESIINILKAKKEIELEEAKSAPELKKGDVITVSKAARPDAVFRKVIHPAESEKMHVHKITKRKDGRMAHLRYDPSSMKGYGINLDQMPDHMDIKVHKEAVELDETLSVVGRLKKAREMTKLSNSGSLQRGKMKKSFAAMTMNRAVKLGWKGARNQMKKNMAKGASYGSLSAATKSRIEKLVSKRVAQRKVLARQLTKGIMAKESINESFALMLEGKRYHQLMNKNGGVKFDMRFKHFREKTSPFFKESTDEEFVEAVAQMFESIQIENRTSAKNMAAFKALNMMMEKNGDIDLQAEKVSRSFGVDINVLKEIYDAYN